MKLYVMHAHIMYDIPVCAYPETGYSCCWVSGDHVTYCYYNQDRYELYDGEHLSTILGFQLKIITMINMLDCMEVSVTLQKCIDSRCCKERHFVTT